jgi:hypothetical protein
MVAGNTSHPEPVLTKLKRSAVEVSDRERVVTFSMMSELETTVGGSGRPETTIKLKIGQSLVCNDTASRSCDKLSAVLCVRMQLKLRSFQRRTNFDTAVTATWWWHSTKKRSSEQPQSRNH